MNQNWRNHLYCDLKFDLFSFKCTDMLLLQPEICDCLFNMLLLSCERPRTVCGGWHTAWRTWGYNQYWCLWRQVETESKSQKSSRKSTGWFYMHCAKSKYSCISKLIFCGKFCKLECESAREGLLCDQGQAEELTGEWSDILSRMWNFIAMWHTDRKLKWQWSSLWTWNVCHWTLK